MAIKKLDTKTVARLRSSLFTNSISQIVSELLQNALDANPTQVEVAVNFAEGFVEVRDDGDGIEPEDFRMLGLRYATSKDVRQRNSFGFRGEALASIAEVSLLEIVSKASHLRTYSLIMRGGKVIHQGPSALSRRPGTTVTVKDIFFNFPVRRKQLPNEKMETIRKAIEPIVLCSPGVSISLIDNAAGTRILSTRKTVSSLEVFKQLFGTSQADNLHAVEFRTDLFHITGFISTVWFPSKMHQYIFIQNYILNSNSCRLYRLVNDLFMDSSFSKQEGDENVFEAGTIPWKSKTVAKLGDSYPIFFLKVDCLGENMVDLFIDPSKNMVEFADWDRIIETIRTCVKDFLGRHGFLSNDPHISLPPGNVSFTIDQEGPECYKNAASLPFSYLPDYELVTKARAGHFRPVPWENDTVVVDHNSTSASLKKRKIGNLIENQNRLHPISGNTHRKHKRVSLIKVSQSQRPEGTSWAGSLIQNWKNPVYDTSGRIGGSNTAEIEKSLGLVSHPLESHKISKADLTDIRVIGQIEKKFIAATFRRNDNIGLLLIDQHAADERVKLEELTEELFRDCSDGSKLNGKRITDVVTLDPPIMVEISKEEAIMASYLRGVFSRWGIGIGEVQNSGLIRSTGDDSNHSTLPVIILPRLIADRCIMNSDVVKAVILEHLHSCNSDGISDNECPDGIYSILNSKACRTAVMFGDHLTPSQCLEVTRKLKTCSFPFQCAHGRPSMTLSMFRKNGSSVPRLYKRRRISKEGLLQHLQ